ncbi:hypothetical protein [Microbacterium sp. HJ5]
MADRASVVRELHLIGRVADRGIRDHYQDEDGAAAAARTIEAELSP